MKLNLQDKSCVIFKSVVKDGLCKSCPYFVVHDSLTDAIVGTGLILDSLIEEMHYRHGYHKFEVVENSN